MSSVTPAVESVLAGGVIANRARVTARGLEIARWGPSRLRFARALTTASRGDARAAFVGDVRDCYGSIAPDVVERALREAGASGADAARVSDQLRRFGARGVRGLPVGPEPSAILANAVLTSVDAALADAAGAPVLRWVDDVVVFTESVRAAERVAGAFEVALGALSLRSHPTKCRVVTDPCELGRSPSEVSTWRARPVA